MSLLFKLAVLACLATVVVGQSNSSTGAAPASGGRPSTTSICDWYTVNGLNMSASSFTAEMALMNAIVSGIFTNALADAGVKKYFDGTIQYRQPGNMEITRAAEPEATGLASPAWVTYPNGTMAPDFTVAANGAALANHLATYFYVATGCSAAVPAAQNAGGGSPYRGIGTMGNIHAGMNITNAVFTTFTGVVDTVLGGLGVTMADRAIMKGVLDGFRQGGAAGAANTICAAADCVLTPASTSSTGGSGGATGAKSPASTLSVSFVSMMVAALMALVAIRA